MQGDLPRDLRGLFRWSVTWTASGQCDRLTKLWTSCWAQQFKRFIKQLQRALPPRAAAPNMADVRFVVPAVRRCWKDPPRIRSPHVSQSDYLQSVGAVNLSNCTRSRCWYWWLNVFPFVSSGRREGGREMEREVRSGTEKRGWNEFSSKTHTSENEIVLGQFKHLMWAFVWVFKSRTLHVFVKQRNLNLM